MERLARAIFALLFAQLPLGALAAVPVKKFDVVKVADGIHAIVWPDPLVDPIEGNVLVVINDDDVVLVDSSFLPSTAERIVKEVKKLTSKPVTYVVNTHWHNDHVQGNQVYRTHWPNVRFIATEHTRKDAIDRAWGEIARGQSDAKAAVEKYQRWLKQDADDDGKPLDEKRRARVREVIDLMRLLIDETKALKPTPPDITFEDTLVLHRGERTIEVRFLGLGNTRGDAVVYLPKERIVATGDLVVHPEPFGFGSYYKEWIDTLGKLAALEAETFVPGHGPVMKDRAYIHTLQELLGDLTKQVDAAVASGKTLEETKAIVTLEEWRKKLSGGDDRIGRSFDAFWVAPAVERAYRQAKGEPEARTQTF